MENCWKTCTSDFFKKMKSGPVRRMRERSKNRKNTKSRKVEKRKTSKSVFSRKVEKSKSGSVREKSKNAKNTKSRKVEKDRFSTFLLFVFFALFLFFYFSIFLLFSLFLFFYFSCEKRRQKMWRLQKPLFFYFLIFWLFSFFSFFFFSFFSQPKTCTDKKIPNVTSNWLSDHGACLGANLQQRNGSGFLERLLQQVDRLKLLRLPWIAHAACKETTAGDMQRLNIDMGWYGYIKVLYIYI